MIQLANCNDLVRAFAGEANNPVKHAFDKSFKHSWRVTGVWREIKVQIHRFLVQSSRDLIVGIQRNLQVQEGERARSIGELPLEFPKVVDGGLEGMP